MGESGWFCHTVILFARYEQVPMFLGFSLCIHGLNFTCAMQTHHPVPFNGEIGKSNDFVALVAS